MYPDDFLNKKLQQRLDDHSLRKLTLPAGKIDLCSNDYLGIVRNGLLKPSSIELTSGSTGSRLLSGNSVLAEDTERLIAHFHQSDSALLFNSGYDANIGLMSSVPQKGDTILYDQLSHASIRDGVRLSFAQSFSFLHNDLSDLEKKLASATGNIFIVTESVFSMDGDTCPLVGLVKLAEQYQAHLIIDEAHATGVIGEKGEGLVQKYQLQKKIFARVHTFGKALGCHGAVVLGSEKLRSYLINFSRSFIYSTALPDHAVDFIRSSYQLFPDMLEERDHLHKLITYFQNSSSRFPFLLSSSPIQAILVLGNEDAKKLAEHLRSKDLDIRAILYPTVPKGGERLRAVLHSYNTFEELDLLVATLNSF
jgi:8-amino-7-oxononanoate synthase